MPHTAETQPIDDDSWLDDYTPGIISVSESAPASAPAPRTDAPVGATEPAAADDDEKLNFAELTRPDRIAALTALRDALDSMLDVEKARLVDSFAGAQDGVSVPSRFGNLSYQPPKTPVSFDTEKMLAYVKDVLPEAVTTRTVEEIDPEIVALLKKDIAYLGDDTWVRPSTGEPVDYAKHGKEQDARIAYPASKLQKLAKAQARHAFAQRLGELSQPILAAVERGDLDKYVEESL